MKTDFASEEKPPRQGLSLGWISRWRAPTQGEIEKYRRTHYPAWLTELREFFQGLHISLLTKQLNTSVTCKLENKGSRPANALLIEFRLSGGMLFAVPPKESEFDTDERQKLRLPLVPRPPRGEWIENLKYPAYGIPPGLGTTKTLQSILQEQRRDPHGFYCYPSKPKEPCDLWAFECQDFRHQAEAESLCGLIPKNWTVEKCSSAQVKGAEGNEEKSVQ